MTTISQIPYMRKNLEHLMSLVKFQRQGRTAEEVVGMGNSGDLSFTSPRPDTLEVHSPKSGLGEFPLVALTFGSKTVDVVYRLSGLSDAFVFSHQLDAAVSDLDRSQHGRFLWRAGSELIAGTARSLDTMPVPFTPNS